jgi:hypothetical protein
LGLPFFREPSDWEKIIFFPGEFSSILVKGSRHLILTISITLTLTRYLWKLYSSSKVVLVPWIWTFFTKEGVWKVRAMPYIYAAIYVFIFHQYNLRIIQQTFCAAECQYESFQPLSDTDRCDGSHVAGQDVHSVPTALGTQAEWGYKRSISNLWVQQLYYIKDLFHMTHWSNWKTTICDINIV